MGVPALVQILCSSVALGKSLCLPRLGFSSSKSKSRCPGSLCPDSNNTIFCSRTIQRCPRRRQVEGTCLGEGALRSTAIACHSPLAALARTPQYSAAHCGMESLSAEVWESLWALLRWRISPLSWSFVGPRATMLYNPKGWSPLCSQCTWFSLEWSNLVSQLQPLTPIFNPPFLTPALCADHLE